VSAPTRQLPLDLPHEASFAREDFLAAPQNAEALARLEAWPLWPSPTMMLVGPPGAGKSHLVAIWARASGARTILGDALAKASPDELADAPALAIDDAHGVGAGEANLFHLLNLARERGLALLLAARAAPDLWGVKTPDLLSRLRLAPIVSLGEPDLELTKAVLLKLFSDRQLSVDPTLVGYIAPRLERSLEAARAIVAALDREALARGKRVTRAMAAAFLRDKDDEE
jgi:chromosomal replication initiation ATPase DnaA